LKSNRSRSICCQMDNALQFSILFSNLCQRH
jgi:hypothetical protein